MTPPLQAEEEGPPTQKDLIPGVIHTFTFPPHDRREQAGFHHLSTCPASLLNPGEGSGLQSNTLRGLSGWDKHRLPQGLERRWP
jgi:hypothetical protein